jgi:hypothetical protein
MKFLNGLDDIPDLDYLRTLGRPDLPIPDFLGDSDRRTRASMYVLPGHSNGCAPNKLANKRTLGIINLL